MASKGRRQSKLSLKKSKDVDAKVQTITDMFKKQKTEKTPSLRKCIDTKAINECDIIIVDSEDEDIDHSPAINNNCKGEQAETRVCRSSSIESSNKYNVSSEAKFPNDNVCLPKSESYSDDKSDTKNDLKGIVREDTNDMQDPPDSENEKNVPCTNHKRGYKHRSCKNVIDNENEKSLDKEKHNLKTEKDNVTTSAKKASKLSMGKRVRENHAEVSSLKRKHVKLTDENTDVCSGDINMCYRQEQQGSSLKKTEIDSLKTNPECEDKIISYDAKESVDASESVVAVTNDEPVDAEELTKETYSTPYYLENFEYILSSVMADDTNAELFNDEDKKIIDKYKNLTGTMYIAQI